MKARCWIVWCVSVSLALLPLAGCKSPPPAPETVHLAAIVIDDARLARHDENVALRVWRDNTPLTVTPRMALRRGDRIETGANVTAVIRWPGVGDGYLRPNGRAVLGSVFIDELTEFFARVRGVFSVETTHSRSAVRGTAFRVRALPGGPVEVTVYDGLVELGSPRGAWPSVTLGAGTMAVAHPGAPRPVQAPADELRRTQDWAARIEKLVESQAGAAGGKTAGIIASIAAVIAVLLLSKDRDKAPNTPSGDTASTDGRRTRSAGSSAETADRGTAPVPAVPSTAPAALQPPARASLRCAPTGPTLAWSAVAHASSYQLSFEQYDGRSWTRAPGYPQTTAATQHTTAALADGQYRWSVQAQGGGGAGPVGGPQNFFCSSVR